MTKLITLDFETYYDQQYSLSKITTEAYVRSPLFETIGVSIKEGDETVWYPQPEVKDAIAAIDWLDALVLGQNTMFDGAILKWRYGVSPLGWMDTMCMSRALYPHERSHSLSSQAKRMQVGEKGNEVVYALGKRYKDFTAEELARYGEYCRNDVDLTYALAAIYLQRFPKKELKLIDLTLKMYIDAVLELDGDLLEKHLRAVKERKAALLDKVRDKLAEPGSDEDVKKLMMSNEKFANLLREHGVEPPRKLSPTTGKETWAFAKTDEAFSALLEHDNEDVQALVACRLGNKSTLEETRTERFIATSLRGTLPIPLKYYGAHSGRWSGLDSVNLQNLPSRGKDANTIKKCIKAPAGYVVIDCDSAQIEARTLAWLAGQWDLVEAFRNKQDVYKLMASKIYHKAPEEIEKGERQVGKTVVLGAGYGVGWRKLQLFLKTQAGVEVSDDEAQRIINTYRQGFPAIPNLWEQGNRMVEALALGQKMPMDPHGLVWAYPGYGLTLPSGLHVQYPDLKRTRDEEGKAEWTYLSKHQRIKVYGGKVVENVCQAIARCIVGEQMLRIAKKYQVVLTVHDSVAVIAPEQDAEDAVKYVESCMSWTPEWADGLPLACESGVGTTYGDC